MYCTNCGALLPNDANFCYKCGGQLPVVTDNSFQDGESDYVKNVGESMVDLLTDISTSQAAQQKIATEMRISVQRVDAICTRLLEKYDSEELQYADFAFLMTAPIAEAED